MLELGGGRPEGVDRGPDGGPAIGVRAPDGVHVAAYGVADGQQPHPRRHRAAAQLRRDAHPEPGLDEGELGVVLLGDVRDARLDPRTAQGEDQPLVAELALVPGDPFVVRELGEEIAARSASRWPAGTAMSTESSSRCVRVSSAGTGIRLLCQSIASAMSRSPRTTAAMLSSGSCSRTRTRRSGWPVRSAVRAWGSRPRMAVGKAPMRSSPTAHPRWASTSAWACSTWEMIRAAWSASSRPASVRRTPRPFFASSGWPTSRSSLAICWDTAEVVTWSPSAAPLTEPWRARASRVRRRSRFNM